MKSDCATSAHTPAPGQRSDHGHRARTDRRDDVDLCNLVEAQVPLQQAVGNGHRGGEREPQREGVQHRHQPFETEELRDVGRPEDEDRRQPDPEEYGNGKRRAHMPLFEVGALDERRPHAY
jgi:hypothetical protein